jgi:hypothetical protein
MAKHSFPIEASNLEAARSYILEQFDTKSWWPTQGPLQAKEEFEQLPATPEALLAWGEKWLDGSQWRQLKNAVEDTPPALG